MSSLKESLALTLKHVYGDLLDLPLLSPSASPSATNQSSYSLHDYKEKIRYCQDCSLHIGRSQLVFGRGPLHARVAFIGDFPSSADDKVGEPFSDECGELLNKMILAMKLKPEEVYLTNLLKCRPPASEKPEEIHAIACRHHLEVEFSHVQATYIVALGEHPARALGRSIAPLSVLRKQEFEWGHRKVFCTHHPRELLKSAAKKKEAWEDLRLVMRAMEQEA